MVKEQELFKNTSKLDEKEVEVFQTFVMKKTNLFLSIFFTLVFVAMGVGCCFYLSLFTGIILAVCGALGGFLLLPYLMKEMMKKQNAKIYGGKKYLNTYCFYEECMTIQTESARGQDGAFEDMSNEKLYYNEVFQALAYRDHLYIYVNARQSFILDYKGMTQGTIAELIDFIKSKNIKFVDKNKK